MHEALQSRKRRALLALAGLWSLPGALPLAKAAKAQTGWVEPRLPAPALRITAADGRKQPLANVMVGKVTAVQLMFTGCRTSCPAQGALFAALAGRGQQADAQLLSVSIDALGDTPSTVSTWQSRFGKSDAWLTAVADVADVDRLVDFMKGTVGKGATHTAQVFVFDRQGRLTYRTGDSPAIAEVEALLARVAQQG